MLGQDASKMYESLQAGEIRLLPVGKSYDLFWRSLIPTLAAIQFREGVQY